MACTVAAFSVVLFCLFSGGFFNLSIQISRRVSLCPAPSALLCTERLCYQLKRDTKRNIIASAKYTTVKYQVPIKCTIPYWRHQMEAFSALLAICAGNSPVTDELPSQKASNADLCIYIYKYEYIYIIYILYIYYIYIYYIYIYIYVRLGGEVAVAE